MHYFVVKCLHDEAISPPVGRLCAKGQNESDSPCQHSELKSDLFNVNVFLVYTPYLTA